MEIVQKLLQQIFTMKNPGREEMTPYKKYFDEDIWEISVISCEKLRQYAVWDSYPHNVWEGSTQCIVNFQNEQVVFEYLI